MRVKALLLQINHQVSDKGGLTLQCSSPQNLAGEVLFFYAGEVLMDLNLAVLL